MMVKIYFGVLLKINLMYHKMAITMKITLIGQVEQ